MGLPRATIVAALLLLGLPAGAQAAQRYAAPGASPAASCAQAAPCSLATAVNEASPGDEVIVESGVYATTVPLIPPESTFVHGDFAGPVPKVTAALSNTVFVAPPNSTLSYVEVEDTASSATGIFCVTGAKVERVVARVAGNQPVGLSAVNNCAVRDSLTVASGPQATALLAYGYEPAPTGTARNVTAIASGAEAVAVKAQHGPTERGTSTFDVRNSILDGAKTDLLATESGFNGETGTYEWVADIVVSNSNFDRATPGAVATIADAGGNQAVAPLFVDAAGGDYREALGSPTIDAGASDPSIGTLDLAGNPRTLGAAPDIGAYELAPVAPSPPPPPAQAAEGDILSLTIAPRRFAAKPSGPPTGGGILRGKPPKGATVSFFLGAPANVEFSVVRLLPGRRVGSHCKRRSRGNAGHGKCFVQKPLKGSFSVSGGAGANSFVFNARLQGKALPPGRYLLVGSAGKTVRRTRFQLVR